MTKVDGHSLDETTQVKRATMQRPERTGFGELDQIVAQVFEAIEAEVDVDEGEGLQRMRHATARNARREAAETVIHREAWNEGLASKVTTGQQARRSSKAQPARKPSFDGEDAGLDDALLDANDRQPPALLSREEEDFVTSTVAWLAARPNPDILLERIWNLTAAAQERSEGDDADMPDAAKEQQPGAKNEH